MKHYVKALVSILLLASVIALVLTSAWHEIGKCSGQGCLFVFPVAGILFLVEYLLLAPSYFWLMMGRAWWGALLAAVSIALSVAGLYKSAGFLDVRMYSPVFGWYLTYPESWPVQYLVWAQLLTVALVLLKVVFQAPLRRLFSDDIG
ncbi:hypothetical protein [Hymenobacter cellulosilyticus]|uniref:Uncharacterized protein n=1 Tax=Hymenobacter cellulosilyticus TaxID=2932248 RepID=A0A8T9QAT1_9BACT|nr:hypothetical protein [Hymenobacter cellulosilyticus]UOQ72910.1 hypothetical protein MUN79_02675 [Hymenobacter cellulosilyticus]